MKTNLFLNLVSVAPLFFAVACAKPENPAKNALDSLKKTQEEVAQTAANVGKAGNKALDATAPGGQPGKVTLSGAITEEIQSNSTRIAVKLETGLSWRKEKATLDKNSLILHSAALEGSNQTSATEGRADEVRLGCKEDELPLDTKITYQFITAQLVKICDLSDYKNMTFTVSADTIVLSDAKIIAEGGMGQWISLSAQEIVLEGANAIRSIAPDSSTTLISGPSVSISARNLRGSGNLSILSQGSSYKP